VLINFRERLDARLQAEALKLVNLTLGMGSTDNAECQRLARTLCQFHAGRPVGIMSDGGWSPQAVQFLNCASNREPRPGETARALMCVPARNRANR